VENKHKHGGSLAIAIYGLTRNPDDSNYMMVMQYTKQGINGNMYSSYITDFGLCRPVSQDSSSKGIFGVLPYITPEVLYGKKYTMKSDIYSFGIIMAEIFTGYPPYHDIPHDFKLATQICLDHRPEIRCKKKKELYKQVEEIKNSGKNSLIRNKVNQTKSTRFNYQTHKQAIYTSRFWNFQNFLNH
ncbi:kinase-like domain-containing protein, partial [Gigaspora rosea]